MSFQAKIKILFGFIFFLPGCSAFQKRSEPVINPAFVSMSERVVAVLPFDNASVYLEAEKYIRDEVVKNISAKGYIPIDLKSVDEILLSMGISDGGQLNAYDPKDLSAKLSARILVYGFIENFLFQNLGFIVRKKVELSLRIIDGLDRSVLYEAQGIGEDSKIHTDKKEAQAAFIINTGAKMIANMADKNWVMKDVTQKAVKMATEKIPAK